MNPTPIPTPNDLAVDPNRVTPGLLGFLAFVFLIITVVVIYFGLRRQLTRIDFDETAGPAGVKPLPKYATKAERRKTALRLQKEREAAEQARMGAAGGAAAVSGAGSDAGADTDAGTGHSAGAGADTGAGAAVAGAEGTATDQSVADAAGVDEAVKQDDPGIRPDAAPRGSDTTPPAQS